MCRSGHRKEGRQSGPPRSSETLVFDVVLVLEDVAVPDEETLAIELRLDAGHLARIGDDRVLEAGLPRIGAISGTLVQLDGLNHLALPIQSQLLAVDHLELHDLARGAGIRGSGAGFSLEP